MPHRAWTICIVAALAALPLTGSLGDFHAPASEASLGLLPTASDVPADIPDSALVLMLARHVGHDVTPLPPVEVPEGLTLPVMVSHLASRAGTPLPLVEAQAAFADVDPRVEAPILATLVAIDAAWTLRDEAFAGVDDAALRAAAREALALAESGDGRGYYERMSEVPGFDPVPLLQGAILLLDTLERELLPLADTLAQSDAWPAEALADPVGVLRIGSTGNDTEWRDRILQVDARGDDTYTNNAGASTWLDTIGLPNDEVGEFWTPVALSIDFSGDDVYSAELAAQADAFAGLGILVERSGDDSYRCERLCQGSAVLGAALFRDIAGNDSYYAGSNAHAAAGQVAALRDSAGDDLHVVGSIAGGYADGAAAVGLLWDQGGTDSYETLTCFPTAVYGWGDDGGRGWLLDDGHFLDYYETASGSCRQTDEHGCNNCTWRAGWGADGPSGVGNDNDGGLAVLLFHP